MRSRLRTFWRAVGGEASQGGYPLSNYRVAMLPTSTKSNVERQFFSAVFHEKNCIPNGVAYGQSRTPRENTVLPYRGRRKVIVLRQGCCDRDLLIHRKRSPFSAGEGKLRPSFDNAASLQVISYDTLRVVMSLLRKRYDMIAPLFNCTVGAS